MPRQQQSSRRGMFRGLGDWIRDSWNREMGIQPGGGFTGRDFGNMMQTLLTSAIVPGASGRLYDFNTQRPMQGFNPFEGWRNRFGGGPQGSPPGPGITPYPGFTGQQSQPVPYPQFTQWGDQFSGPPSDPNYDQIHQGPPSSQAGGRPNRPPPQPLTRAQQENLLEQARIESSQRQLRDQARAAMEEMYGRSER